MLANNAQVQTTNMGVLSWMNQSHSRQLGQSSSTQSLLLVPIMPSSSLIFKVAFSSSVSSEHTVWSVFAVCHPTVILPQKCIRNNPYFAWFVHLCNTSDT